MNIQMTCQLIAPNGEEIRVLNVNVADTTEAPGNYINGLSESDVVSMAVHAVRRDAWDAAQDVNEDAVGDELIARGWSVKEADFSAYGEDEATWHAA